jgi:rhomboid family GlyGly-CTERM serine protease
MLSGMKTETETGHLPASVTGAQVWVGVCGLLVFGALIGWFVPADRLDWQPARALAQPWRWWTAAFVHLSPLHLGANALGALAVAWLGWAGAVPRRVATAWLLAWPLTHLLLAVMAPDLAHYGGLSGVLHAGVAAAGVHLAGVRAPRGADPAVVRSRRRIGAAILAVLAAKLLTETPWGPAARAVEGWDILVAPIAHTTGALAAAVVAGLLEWRARRRDADDPLPPTRSPLTP